MGVDCPMAPSVWTVVAILMALRKSSLTRTEGRLLLDRKIATHVLLSSSELTSMRLGSNCAMVHVSAGHLARNRSLSVNAGGWLLLLELKARV